MESHERLREACEEMKWRWPGEKTHLTAQRLVPIVNYETKTLGIRHCMVLWKKKRQVSKVWQVAMAMEWEVDWTQRNSYALTTLPALSSDSLPNLVLGVRPS